MTTELTLVEDQPVIKEQDKQFVTVYVGEQLVGLPILSVQDVLNPLAYAHVPLSSPEIIGLINLRGRIVTAIDVRIKLGLPKLENLDKRRSVVVEHKGELYALYVDSVGDVMNVPESTHEQNPANLEGEWKDISTGVYRLNEKIMVILDITKLLDY
jgi:purine-binding chemotaxis protein CheW